MEKAIYKGKIVEVNPIDLNQVRYEGGDEWDWFYVPKDSLKSEHQKSEKTEERKCRLIAAGVPLYPESCKISNRGQYLGTDTPAEAAIIPWILAVGEIVFYAVRGDEIQAAMRLSRETGVSVEEVQTWVRSGGNRTTESRGLTLDLALPYPSDLKIGLILQQWADENHIYLNHFGKFKDIQVANQQFIKRLIAVFGMRPKVVTS